MTKKIQDDQEYMIKYLEEKFSSVENKIDSFTEQYTSEIKTIKENIKELGDKQSSQGTKITFASGAVWVIILLGGFLFLSFKTLNKQQIQDTVGPLEVKVTSLQSSTDTLQKMVETIIKNK